MIRRWFFADAAWWQFWMPQSGPVGGLIGGGMLSALILWGAGGA